MPLPLYGERERWLIPIRASYSIHKGNVSLTPMGLTAPPTHITGYTCSVLRWVPLVCNDKYLSMRLTSFRLENMNLT